MTPEMMLELATNSITTLLVVIAPIMAVALVAGLIVALFQALTSIQEMTLTFVPKIVLVFAVMLLTLPWMADKIHTFSMDLFDKIVQVGTDQND